MNEFDVDGDWVCCVGAFWFMAASAFDEAPMGRAKGKCGIVSSFTNRGFGASRVLGQTNANTDGLYSE